MTGNPVATSKEAERGDVKTRPSRRALLAGGLGALGAWAAGALGRGAKVQAADGDPVLIGATNAATSHTILENSTNDAPLLTVRSTHDGSAIGGISVGHGTGVSGHTNNGTGVHGVAEIGIGVRGYSVQGEAVHALSDSKFAVFGANDTTEYPAILGTSPGIGVSGRGLTGVYGESSKTGVSGFSPRGRGVHGKTTSGYAGFFEGKVFTNHSYQLAAATGTKRATIFLRPSAGGHAQLCVRFNNGVVRVLATD